MKVAAIVVAHGIGGVKDLPVPGWLFLYGAAVVLVASFAALGLLWREPRLDPARRGRRVPELLQRFLLSRALRGACGLVGVGLLVLVVAAALVGEPSPTRNLAPTFVWVVFWLGLVPVVVLGGNVWPALNPWRAVADALVRLSARAGVNWEPLGAYPERLGRWPAAVLLFGFTTLELAYTDPASPPSLGVAILVYSAVTWYGMVWFGREKWLANGEAFSVYFALLGRIAPLAVRERDGGRGRRARSLHRAGTA